jgi:rhodanese-related sulfurtransferase
MASTRLPITDNTLQKKWLLETLISVILCAIGGWYVYDIVRTGSQTLFPPEVAMISALDASIEIEEGRGLLLDVRRNVTGKVMARGAIHAPAVMLDALAETLPKDRQLIVYCSCSGDSAAIHVALKLKALGFQEVAAMRDGIYGWLVEDLPIQYGE